MPTSENCLSLDKWKKSSPPLTYLQKCKLENTWMNKFLVSLRFAFVVNANLKLTSKMLKLTPKILKLTPYLILKETYSITKHSRSEVVKEYLRPWGIFFWWPTRKECNGLLLLRWISFWYSKVHGWCCWWITYYEERMSGALKDSVLCHRVFHLVLLYDHL